MALTSLIDEALGALGGSLITRLLLFQLLVLFGQLLLVIIFTTLRPSLFLLILFSVDWFLFLFLVVVSFASALGLLLGGRHGELVPTLMRCNMGVVMVTKVALSPIIFFATSSCCLMLFLFLVSLLLILILGGLLIISRFVVLVFAGRFGFRCGLTEPSGQIRSTCMSGSGFCSRFHAVVGQRDGLDVGDEVTGCGGSLVIIVDTLAASHFSEAFLALEIAIKLFYCVPLKLVFIILFPIVVGRRLSMWHFTTKVFHFLALEAHESGQIELLGVG